MRDIDLINNFFRKYPNCTSIKIVHETLWEEGRTTLLPVAAWITLPDRTVHIHVAENAELLMRKAVTK
ncbi:MAG: hypothetical protein AB7U73_08255 [Pirellulales bacterium]